MVLEVIFQQKDPENERIRIIAFQRMSKFLNRFSSLKVAVSITHAPDLEHFRRQRVKVYVDFIGILLENGSASLMIFMCNSDLGRGLYVQEIPLIRHRNQRSYSVIEGFYRQN